MDNIEHTPANTMTTRLAAIDKLAQRLIEEAEKYKKLHEENPEEWTPITDLGNLINDVTLALDNNSI